jgi:predicted dehydrogenase
VHQGDVALLLMWGGGLVWDMRIHHFQFVIATAGCERCVTGVAAMLRVCACVVGLNV